MKQIPQLSVLAAICVLAAGLVSSACGKDEPINFGDSAADDDDAADDDMGGDDDQADDDQADDDMLDDDGFGDPPIGPSPPTGPTGVIGTACEDDGDCASGTYCMLSSSDDFLGGGPANGYCTADCASAPESCSEIDANSLCIELPDAGSVCMLGCLPGSPVEGENKCNNRLDLACDLLTNGAFCRPMCRNDADCGDRVCDLGSGTCVDELAGDPVGAPCTPGEDQTCASQLCFPLTDDTGFCSGQCNVGTLLDSDQRTCGSSEDPQQPGEPLCIFIAFEGGGGGDLGFCGLRCNCDDDCELDGTVCEQLGDEADELFGTLGVCISDEPFAEGEPPPEGLACEATDGGSNPPAETDAGTDAGASPSSPDAG